MKKERKSGKNRERREGGRNIVIERKEKESEREREKVKEKERKAEKERKV